MCCFHLHFSGLNVLFFPKKNCCRLLLKKKHVVQKERKNNLSRGKIPALPQDIKWSVPNCLAGPSLFLYITGL